MSFGFAVYRNDGSVKISEDGGIACFIESSTQKSLSTRGYPEEWVWFTQSVISIDRDVAEWDMPGNLCYIENGQIKHRTEPGTVTTIYWGIA